MVSKPSVSRGRFLVFCLPRHNRNLADLCQSQRHTRRNGGVKSPVSEDPFYFPLQRPLLESSPDSVSHSLSTVGDNFGFIRLP